MEPPYWYYPVHQSLGAALLKQGKHREAADAFTTALARSPNNGWALYGLAAAERMQGRGAQAAAATAALSATGSAIRAGCGWTGCSRPPARPPFTSQRPSCIRTIIQ